MKRLLLLVVVVVASSWLGAADNKPRFRVGRISHAENRWVAHLPRENARDAQFLFGFVYVDPEAGFTFHLVGYFTVEESGVLKSLPAGLEGVALKSRLPSDQRVVLLDDPQREQLGLPEKPDWLRFYEDKSPPALHAANWGRAYNHIGACAKALEFLEPAYTEAPKDEALLFELAYAYNATERFADAERVLKKPIEDGSNNFFLRRELAYAFLHSGHGPEAVREYRVCTELCPADNLRERSEMAFNLAQALKAVGEAKESDDWMKKAREWAPEGSTVAEYFRSVDAAKTSK